MIERDSDGRLVVRPRPGNRGTTAATEPSVVGLSVAQRFDRLGRRINRNERRVCTARTVNGEPCRAYAIAGSNVCRVHGGSAPQVKAAAKVRMENAADRMARELLNMAVDDDIPPAVKLSAIKDALDRAGLSPTRSVEISSGETPFEVALGLVQVRRGPRDPGDAPEQPAIESGEVVDVEVLDYEPVPRSLRSSASPARPAGPVTREPRIDVNPDLPSYLDPVTGGRRRERIGPRTSEMKR